MAQPYKKLELKKFPKSHSVDSTESAFWKKFRFPILLQQHAAVTCVDFSPIAPHDFIVTSSARAQIFDCHTNEVKKSLNRFKEAAYSARYRSDGQLVVAGGEEGAIRVFDPRNRSLLRIFWEAHSRPIHVTRFSPNNLHIMAASDDCTVSCSDLQTGEKLFSLLGHKDQVRAGIVSPTSEHIWITGSHDHTVKLWDTRTKECLSTLEHQYPIEDMLVLPGGSLLATAAGNEVAIWDVLGGFRKLDTLFPHQKAVTGIAFDPTRSRLFSSSLDNTVKVFDSNTYKIVHVIKYTAPVLSLGISPNSSHLVTGMSDGMLSIRYRLIKSELDSQENTLFKLVTGHSKDLSIINQQYLQRGTDYAGAVSDFKIEKVKRLKLKPYDKYLRKFQYKKALDAAIATRDPVVICSILEEFSRRQALSIPLSSRNEITLKPLIQFILVHIRNPKFTSTLILVSNKIFDIYSPTIGLSAGIDQLYLKLHRKIKEEIEFQKNLFVLQGIFESLFAARELAVAPKQREEANIPAAQPDLDSMLDTSS